MGRSWIDITMADRVTADNIFKWTVGKEPSCSDHNSISFSMYAGKNARYKPNRFKLKNLDPVALKTATNDIFRDKTDDLDKEVDNCVNKMLEA
ncbi:hypothetical protein AVEN_34329-1 [Araneus ventricosus]|uniref:Endonuclease/exonuclease/phosphatase domain-containing protein n=1 Tax=Araneus ventricosus TaxID=182803 RepID=A0A4Y2G2Q1_ARAVE|nr:hypothetical protein AVEN_34329-1 [Araneus ventricosus]